MTDPKLFQKAPETNLLRAAGIALAVLSLGAIAFAGTYALAGAIYHAPAPGETATAVIPTEPDAFASTTLIAKAAYVEDLTTGQVLYSENAQAQLPLASLTTDLNTVVQSLSNTVAPSIVIASGAATAAGTYSQSGTVATFTLKDGSSTVANWVWAPT